jgi:hypothetical protein
LTPFVFVSILIGFQVLISSIVGKTPIFDNRTPEAYPNYLMLTHPPGLKNNAIIFQNLAAVGGVQLYYSGSSGIDYGFLGNYSLGTGILGKVQPPMGNSTPILLQEFNPEDSGEIVYSPFQYIPINFVSFGNKNDMENAMFDKHYKLPSIVGGYYFDTVSRNFLGIFL